VLAALLRDGAVLTLGRTKVAFALGADPVRLPVSAEESFGAMIGRSAAMRAVFALLEHASQSDVTVLLQGETGTGKDVAAESIHRQSARRDGPFVVVDCGAIPPTLLESELFGHERGAFTGAGAARAGAVEAASGGTLFLDEVGEVPLDLQPKLLRTLDTRTTQRVGSTRRVPVDVRIVAATNRNLKVEVNAGRFRADLYYRLAVVEIVLPPLHQRPEDIPPLVEQFLASTGAGGATADLLRSDAVRFDLEHHSWPGNVRELRNYVERCLALGQRAPFPARGEREETAPSVDASRPFGPERDRWMRYFERRYIEDLLSRHGNNVSAAARAAGIDRVYLYRLMSRSGAAR